MKELLYDFSAEQSIKRRNFWLKMRFALVGFGVIMSALFMLSYAFLVIGVENWTENIAYGVFGSLIALPPSILHIISIFTVTSLKVWKDGIVPPRKKIRDVIFRRETTISIENIERIYLNLKNDIRYIVIKCKSGKRDFYVIPKKDIFDIEAFVAATVDKVNIERDNIWLLGKGEVKR